MILMCSWSIYPEVTHSFLRTPKCSLSKTPTMNWASSWYQASENISRCKDEYIMPPSRWSNMCKIKVHNESESRSVVSDSLWPPGLYSPWNSLGQNTGVGSLSLLQGLLPTQGLNPGLPHCKRTLYQLSHKGNPRILELG